MAYVQLSWTREYLVVSLKPIMDSLRKCQSAFLLVLLSICTHSCVANSRLIFATCSLSSMSLSPWSPLSFLLVGLMGGGPVLWLEMEEEDDEDEDEEEEDEEEDRDRDWSLGSPLKAASPEKKRREKRKDRERFVSDVEAQFKMSKC